MKISIIHPSRSRSDLASRTATKWLTSMKTPCEYFFAIDGIDPNKEEYVAIAKSLQKIFFDKHIVECYVTDSTTSVEAINNVAKKTSNDLLVVVSDDFDCFDGWDEWLLSKVSNSMDFIVKTTDKIQKWLITLPIMDRTYYNRFGYIYYPGYKHLFSDTEMTDVAHILGRVIDLQDEQHIFLHNHPCAGRSAVDDTYRKNDETWKQGEDLYNERKKHNFYL